MSRTAYVAGRYLPHRHADLRVAIGQIYALIAAQPNNPYFHELKGQAFLEGGKPDEAVAPLRRAIQLAPHPALIQVLLAQALNAQNNPKGADEAVTLLRTALAKEPESADGYSQLAMAYGRKGDLAQADLASALAAFMRGDGPTARQLAARAKTRFPIGSPGWVRAEIASSADWYSAASAGDSASEPPEPRTVADSARASLSVSPAAAPARNASQTTPRT